MLKSLFIYISLSISTTMAFAQTYYFRNEGMIVKNSSTHNLKIKQGNIVNNGTLDNAGKVYLDGNYSQNAAGNYIGGITSWLWFEGSTNQSISSVSALTVARLKVQNNNRLILQSNLQVTNALDLTSSSSLELGNNTLSCPNINISNYGTSNYIITNGTGALVQTFAAGDIKEYPVGNSTYNPVILLSNAGVTDNFSVRIADQILTAGNTGSNEASDNVNRTWHISEGVAGGNDMDISVEWATTQELASFDRTNSTIKHWNGSTWDVGTYGAALASSGRWSQTRSHVTAFSPFGVIDNTSSTFPIELTNFTAYRQTIDNVLLKWATQTETNNDHFEIERMLDNESSFTKIGTLAGYGTTAEPHQYKFIDYNGYANTTYYRLKQVDTDGTFTYSTVCAVRGEASPQHIELFPNPVHDVLNIRHQTPIAAPAILSILNAQGQTIWTDKQVLHPNQLISVEAVSALAADVYVLRIQFIEGNSFHYKFIKQ